MTNRQRILAILAGEPPDRIPWIPRLGIWYEANRRAGTLPPEYRGWGLRQIERDVFGGTAARDGVIWHTRLRNVEVRVHQPSPMETVTEYVTPVGTVTTQVRATEHLRRQGIQDAEVGFMLKRREDYPVVEYLVEQTDYLPAYEEYLAYERDVGQEGYPMVNCGDCPFHYWMRALAGYNQAFYHLQDYASQVERLLAVMTDRFKQTVWRHMLDSPARLLMHGHHLSSQMTPPPLFRRYILPYYQELTPLLRAHGKCVAIHADNDTRLILGLIAEAGIGMAECFVSSPMVPTTLAEARAAWQDRVIIWGGVPSVILEEPYTDEQFEQYMDELFRVIPPGRAFILGIADNAMPGSKIERIRRISALVAERGNYPIRA
ncbi:MAG: uroporphyrinogen decarboxylase family protein [Thermoguttaceae bacterium]